MWYIIVFSLIYVESIVHAYEIFFRLEISIDFGLPMFSSYIMWKQNLWGKLPEFLWTRRNLTLILSYVHWRQVLVPLAEVWYCIISISFSYISFFFSTKFREDLVIHQQQSQGRILMILVLHQDGRAPHFLVWTQFMKKWVLKSVAHVDCDGYYLSNVCVLLLICRSRHQIQLPTTVVMIIFLWLRSLWEVIK